jgi:hypothetical protein
MGSSKSAGEKTRGCGWVAFAVILTLGFVVPFVFLLSEGRYGRSLIPLLLFGDSIVVLLVVAGVFEAWRGRALRRTAMMEFARSHGFEYSDMDFENLPSKYNLEKAGIGGEVLRMVSGPLFDGRIVCFDCGADGIFGMTFTSICAFEVPASFEELLVRPETPADRAKAFIGRTDVRLDSTEFNDLFFVKCASAEFAHKILHHRTMEYFLDYPELRMYMNDNYFVVFIASESPQRRGKFERLFAHAKAFAELLPNYLKTQE